VTAHLRRVKYWEIIADNLSKLLVVGAASQRLIPTGERSGLPTFTAMMESGTLRMPMKS
jgi:hypothetical protein